MNKQTYIIALGTVLVGLSTIAAGCSPKTGETPVVVQPSVSAPTGTASVSDEKVPSSATTTATGVKPSVKVAAPSVKKPVIVSPQLNILRVNIQKMAFSPQIIAVKAGDTVQWVNTDTVPHTVTSDGSLLWDSGTIQPGASFERQFKFAGSYPYHCGIHSTMKGTVVIN